VGPFGRFIDSGFALRVAYALCLLGATFNHATTIIAHGLFWDYGGLPWPSAAFWTTLTFADPTAALLLFLLPRLGLITTAVIIASDVVHNCWITLYEGARHGFPHQIGAYTMLIEQIVFLLFVAATIRVAWVRAQPQNRRELIST